MNDSEDNNLPFSVEASLAISEMAKQISQYELESLIIYAHRQAEARGAKEIESQDFECEHESFAIRYFPDGSYRGWCCVACGALALPTADTESP